MDTGFYMKGEERFGFISSNLYSKFSVIYSKRFYRAVLGKIKEYSPKRILDVGCGPGDILTSISKNFIGLKLYGVDPSQSMVDIARKKAMKTGYNPAIKIEQGSSRLVPFDINFDLIITSLSYHHWKEQRSSLEYLLSLLDDSGSLVIFELNPEKYPGKFPLVRSHTLSKEEAQKMEFSGYEQYIEFSPDKKLIVVSFRRMWD